MLAEFLTKIEQMVAARRTVEFKDIPGNPRETAVVDAGALSYRPKPAPITHLVARDLSSLKDMIEKQCTKPVAFVNERGVVVLRDADDRREVITLPFAYDDRYLLLVGMEGQKEISGTTDEIIRMIRFRLNGIGAEPLIEALNSLDFERKGADSRRTEHGRETLGRAVEAVAQGRDDVPKDFVAVVPPFTTRGLDRDMVTAKIGVYLDVNAARVTLYPLGGELAKAREAALQCAAGRVSADIECPVYLGYPKVVGLDKAAYQD